MVKLGCKRIPMPVGLDLFLSRKIRVWLFASMVMLLFVHGYNLNWRYLQPFSIVQEPLTVTTFLEYFFSNGLFRFFIPMLFAISGYLYAAKDDRPYGKTIAKRFRTLVVPYLFWSAMGLLFTYILESTAYGRGVVETTHLMTMSHNRILLHDYSWYDWLLRWILLPVPYQLWFLRVLFVYCLIYPALRWCVLHYPLVFFVCCVLFWISNIDFILWEGEGLLFFSLGIWIRKTGFNILLPNRWTRPLPWGIVFVTLTVIKTFLAFEAQPVLGQWVFPLLLLLHKMVVASGLIAAWFGLDKWVIWSMGKSWFEWLLPFSFMIYVMHAPLVAYAINAIFPLVQRVPHYRLLVYLFLPMALLTVCVGCAALLRSTVPRLYAVATGGRGGFGGTG
jgi:fucose 4-O-acetylase-like acetyltransferase